MQCISNPPHPQQFTVVIRKLFSTIRRSKQKPAAAPARTPNPIYEWSGYNNGRYSLQAHGWCAWIDLELVEGDWHVRVIATNSTLSTTDIGVFAIEALSGGI